MPTYAEQKYERITQDFLSEMRRVKASKEEFYEGLRAALGELEIEVQACKETL